MSFVSAMCLFSIKLGEIISVCVSVVFEHFQHSLTYCAKTANRDYFGLIVISNVRTVSSLIYIYGGDLAKMSQGVC